MPNKRIEERSSKEIYKQTIGLIEKERIILLLTGTSVKDVIAGSEHTCGNGFNLVGVDLRIPGIKDALKSLKKQGKRNLGVFSVSTKKEARIAIRAGAVFVFSTHLDKGIVRKCKKEKVFHAAGSLTPTEVFNAYDLGSDAVSLFPCDKMGGLSWLQFLKSVFPKIKLIPTGAMSPYEAGQYIKSGAFAVAPLINLESSKDVQKEIKEFLSATSE